MIFCIHRSILSPGLTDLSWLLYLSPLLYVALLSYLWNLLLLYRIQSPMTTSPRIYHLTPPPRYPSTITLLSKRPIKFTMLLIGKCHSPAETLITYGNGLWIREGLLRKLRLLKILTIWRKRFSTVLFFVGINVYCCSHQLNHQLAGGYRHDSKSFVQIDMSDFDFDG